MPTPNAAIEIARSAGLDRIAENYADELVAARSDAIKLQAVLKALPQPSVEPVTVYDIARTGVVSS